MSPMLISIWSAAFLLLLVALWFQGRSRKVRLHKKIDGIHPFNLKLYHLLLRFSYTRAVALKYQYSLKQLSRLREEALYHAVGNFFRRLLLVFCVVLSIILVMTQNILYIGMYVFVTGVLLEVFVDYILVKRHNQLLKGQILFDELVRQKYYEQGTVEEAIYEACQEFPDKESPMLIQGEYLYDVLMESNVEEAVQIYNQHAPNKYLKMLLNLCYITSEYGDSKENGQSVFMNSLSHLTNEIRVEEMKRERLNYSLKSLHLIAILPLLCMLPLQNWASHNFQPLQVFYAGSYGKAIEVVMFCIILFAVMILRKIQNVGIISELRRERQRKTEILQKRRRARFFYFLLGIGIVMFINVQESQRLRRTSVLEDSALYVPEDKNWERIREKEMEWIDAVPKGAEQEAVIALFSQRMAYQPELSHLQGKMAEQYTEKLYRKYRNLQKPWMGVWQILGIAGIAFLMGYWQVVTEKMVKRVREMEREDEVAGYRSILLMLMHHQRLGMEDILGWLNMFADYYENVFERCLNHFSMGTEEAFAELKKEKQNDFQTMVLQLEAASRDLSLKQAFDDLVHEKAYYLERRKEINQQMIAKRLAMGELIGFLPAYALIVLYLIVPMVYSGMESLQQFYQQI